MRKTQGATLPGLREGMSALRRRMPQNGSVTSVHHQRNRERPLLKWPIVNGHLIETA